MKKIEINWQYDGDIEYVNTCVLCDASSFETDITFSEKLGLIDPFSCKKCLSCGLRWLNPRPTQEGYQRIYTMDNYFGDGTTSPENFAILEENRKFLFRNRLKKIKRYCLTTHRQKKILDIGAATGLFVHEAERMGYNATGIEISHEARKEAERKYSVNLLGASLEDLIFQGYKFDVIHMNHVFEHILYPGKCLQECRELLNNEGLLIIEVPQQFSNDIERLKRMLRIYKKPVFNPYSLHHAYFYTPNTIISMIEKYCFLVCQVKTNKILSPMNNFKNLILSIYLFVSDKLHKGGSIIEVFAKKN